MEQALRFKIVRSLSSACSLSHHLSFPGLSRLGGPVLSFYPINMAARVCHQDETETSGQLGLGGLDDRWRVFNIVFFLPSRSHYAGGIFLHCFLGEIWGQRWWRKANVCI